MQSETPTLWSSQKERDAFVMKHQKLAMMVAHRMRHASIEPYEDLLQIAMMGLIAAANKFDPSRGYAFSSFSVPFIRGAILHWVRDKGSQIRVPRRWREDYAAGQKHANPAEALGLTQAEWRERKEACEARCTAFPESWEPTDTRTPPEEDEGPDENLMLKEYRLQLEDGMKRLPKKHRDIIQYAYIDKKPLGAWDKGTSAAEASEELGKALALLREIISGRVYLPIEEQLNLF
jgi:RNA polymerase sigma-B factor